MPHSLITTAQAAAQLGIERSTLSRWVAAGRITPAMQLPGPTGAMLFDPVAIDRLAASLVKAKASA